MKDEDLKNLMCNLDDDLIEKELDLLMDDINVDTKSIKKKSFKKLEEYEKRNKYMKKKKLY